MNKKQLESIIVKITEKIESDPKKAASLIADWIRRPSGSIHKQSQKQKATQNTKTIVRKKVA